MKLSKVQRQEITNLRILKNKIKALLYYSRNGGICVNVKLHDMKTVTIDDIFNHIDIVNLNLSNLELKLLKNTFGSDLGISNIFSEWLASERDYFIDDYYLGTCTICSPKYWNELIESVKNGIRSGYPHIDSIETLAGKIAKLEELKENDKKICDAFNHLHKDTFGLTGRSGGWLQVDLAEFYTDSLEQIENFLNDCNSSESFEDCFGNLDLVSIEKVDAMLYVISDIEELLSDFKNSNSFLEYVVNMVVETATE